MAPQMTERLELKARYPGITDDLLDSILIDDNPQRKAEVLASTKARSLKLPVRIVVSLRIRVSLILLLASFSIFVETDVLPNPSVPKTRYRLEPLVVGTSKVSFEEFVVWLLLSRVKSFLVSVTGARTRILIRSERPQSLKRTDKTAHKSRFCNSKQRIRL